MNTLELIGTKYGTDKVTHGYMEIYASYFKKNKEKEITLLEIGVYNGASIVTWREYFPHAYIVGMDVEEKSSLFNPLPGRNSFFTGDQGDTGDLEVICEKINKDTGKGFDIIIDDGSHFQHDMMFSFGKLFPHMNKGGVYVIEDMCQAKDLETGSRWWGSPDENHQHTNLPGIKLSTLQKKNWLPNGKKNLYYSAETTMKRFEETKVFDSAFLTNEECAYVTRNSASVKFFKATEPPLSPNCLSSVAAVEHI